MNNSMTIGGVDLGGELYRFVVEGNDFIYSPQPRVERNPLAMADGEAVQGATFGARTGVVMGVVHASSYENLQAQRDAIEAALSLSQTGAQVTTFDSTPGKEWRCRVIGATWSNESACTIDLSVTLLAPDPWPLSSEATVVSGNTNAGGVTPV